MVAGETRFFVISRFALIPWRDGFLGVSNVDQLFAAPGTSALIKDTSTDHFMADVIEASMTVPVIVDFWAPWCGPCKQLGPMLEKAVTAANGAVRMVKLNIDEHPEIPTQMRVQSIPAVFAFKDGRPVDGFTGALPESQIKAFVKRLSGQAGPSALDEALDVARQALGEGEIAAAENIFQQIIQRHPDNIPALVGLARCALVAKDLDRARQILARIPATEAKAAEVVALRTAIELAEQAEQAQGFIHQFEQRLAQDANDHEARIELAKALFGAGAQEAAIEHLLTAIKADRQWQEEAARKQLLKFLEALGFADPLAVKTRKRLSTLLFS